MMPYDLLAAKNRTAKKYLARHAEAKRLSKILLVPVSVHVDCCTLEATESFVVPGDWLRAVAKRAKDDKRGDGPRGD